MTGNDPTVERLGDLLAEAGLQPLPAAQLESFDQYLALLLRWNAHINLTAIREPMEILRRHFVESIHCAQGLQSEIRTLLDLGSGAGFPGVPIAICRPEILVTLAESQGKKASFLREVVRRLGLEARVHGARAESLTERFDCVTLRAVDRMQVVVRLAGSLVGDGGWLAPMTTRAELPAIMESAGPKFAWSDPIGIRFDDNRILALGRRVG